MTDDCCSGAPVPAFDSATTADVAKRLGALADPTRLQIISILDAARASHSNADNDPGEARSDADAIATGAVCACDFVGPLGKSQPTVSHHLKVLAQADLIVGERHGRWIWYRLAEDGLDTLASALGRLGVRERSN